VKTILTGLAATALVLVTASRARAEGEDASRTNELGLEDVLRSVDIAFPLLLAAAREKDEAQGAALSADGGFDPSLKASGFYEPVSGYPRQYLTVQADQPTPLWGSSFFVGYRYGSGKFPIYDGKLDTNDYGEVRGGVRVPLWRDGPIDRRRASIRQAELGVSLASLSLDQARIEARRAGAFRYWDWVAAGRRVSVLRSWLALAVVRDAALAARAERGDIPEIERTENQRTIFQRQAAVVGAERDLLQASMELSLYIRGADRQPLVPDASRLPRRLPAPAPVDVLGGRAEEERALARRPDVKRFDLVRDRSRIEADLARNQQKPGIDVTLYGARQFGPGDPIRGEPVVGAALVLDIPILNRVQNGREQTAEASVAKASDQQRFARDRVVADVRTALASIDAAQKRASMAENEARVAAQLADAELRRFDLGESTLLLVNLREQANAEAKVREIDAVADFHRAEASFRAATARDLK